MGSRMMHVLIAYETGRRIGVADLPRFLLGGIAPDAHHRMGAPKDPSHFLRWDEGKQRKFVDYEWFAAKYEAQSEDDYFLGYLTHLIADHVWLTTVFEKHILSLSKEDREWMLPLYYADFRALNGKLIEAYSAHEVLEVLGQASDGMELDEVSFEAVLGVKEEVGQDFRYERSELDEPLRVFTLKEIMAYMEQSVRLAVSRLQKVSPVR